MMFRRFVVAMRYAFEEENFGRVLSAAGLLVLVGTMSYSLGENWSVIDGFYVAVATLTTSSILDPQLVITQPWLKVFTAFYVLVGIGILVELGRRLGTGFIASRNDVAPSGGADK